MAAVTHFSGDLMVSADIMSVRVIMEKGTKNISDMNYLFSFVGFSSKHAVRQLFRSSIFDRSQNKKLPLA